MTAIGDFCGDTLGYDTGDPPDLLQGSILVVDALHRQQRAGNRDQLLGDIPVAEFGTQPDVVPAPKGRVDIGVVARQALAQVRFQVRGASSGNVGNRNFQRS